MIKRSRAQWFELFHKHEASGLNAAQFCRDENLCQRYFSKRKTQLGWQQKKTTKAAKQKSAGEFIQVSVANTEVSCHIECGHLKLLVNQLPPANWVGELLKQLR